RISCGADGQEHDSTKRNWLDHIHSDSVSRAVTPLAVRRFSKRLPDRMPMRWWQMTARTIFCALTVLLCVETLAAEPSASPTPAATISPAESPPPTIAQSVTDLSAQRAAAERSKIYRVGRDYSSWLDQVAKDSGNAFLPRKVFENVTWMRLLGSIGG